MADAEKLEVVESIEEIEGQTEELAKEIDIPELVCVKLENFELRMGMARNAMNDLLKNRDTWLEQVKEEHGFDISKYRVDIENKKGMLIEEGN